VEIPAYWLSRPDVRPDPQLTASFDQLLDEALARGPEHPLDYRLAAPKWRFLCHTAERGGMVLHGSGDPGITEFEPRQPGDDLEFSNRLAVFAATDGIWPIFYAILDRVRHPSANMCNGCFRLGSPTRHGDSRYFFSISAPVLAQQPWREGTVYLLPADSFEHQPPIELAHTSVYIAQSASPVPVKPLAKLTVGPADFPYLHQVHGHDDAVLAARMAADPDGFPWFEED
jgi:hypothetical protein